MHKITLSILIGLLFTLNVVYLTVNDVREIIVYHHCTSNETSSDITYSINQIEEHLNNKHISVHINKERRLCGYLFINGSKRKMISSALTDMDLLEEVDKFFSVN
jgi:hypothetical protein